MRLSNFRYTLPKTRIADHPVEPRDSCKMMVLNRRKKEVEHKTFEDIASYFKKGDLKETASVVEAFGRVETLDAHARSASIRLGK